MADNSSQKPPKPGENSKIANTANIVGNETLRMGEQDKVVSHPTCLAAGTAVNQRKKAPSFQITSVSVGSNSRTSNDGGDDSADDLDESHTDDVSIDNSRITDVDNETPSFSEDTFSKDDLYLNPANPSTITSVPVIPTSSQYGLAIVGTDTENSTSNATLTAAVVCANNISAGDSSVKITDSGGVINITSNTKSDVEMRDLPPHHASRNERFKVVKIESTEPFKRGRWMCMDYLDHTILQQQQTQLSGINLKPTDVDSSAGAINFVSTESGAVISTDNHLQRTQDEHVDPAFSKSLMQDNQLGTQQNTLILPTGQTRPIFTNISPGQSLQHDLQQIPVGTTQNLQNHQPQINQQVNMPSQQVSNQPQQVSNQPQQISSQSLPLGSQIQPINPQSHQINSQSQQVNPHPQQMGSQAQHNMNPQGQQINQHLQQQYNSQQINPQSQQFNPQPQQNIQPQAQNQVNLISQSQQINPQTQQVNQQSQQFNSHGSHMNSQPQQFNSQSQQFNQQTPQQMHQGSGQQNISQMQQNLPGQNFQTGSTQQVSQAQSMSQVPIQCATSMASAQSLQHQSLPPQQLQQVINAVNMQQMGVQQGLVQQQHLMQQVSHQGLNQYQHTSQYYGQGGIQMLPPQSGMATSNSIASVSLQHPSQPVQSSASMPMSIQNTGGMTSQSLPQMTQRQQQMTVQNQQQQMQQQIHLQQMAARQPQSLQQIPLQQQQQVPIQTQYSVQQHFPVQQQYPVQQQFPLQQQMPLVQLFPVAQQQQVPMQSQQVSMQPHQQQILQQNYQQMPNIQQSGQQILTRNVPMGDSQNVSSLTQGHSINQPNLIQGNQAPPGLHQNYVQQVPSSTQSDPYFTPMNSRTETQVAGTGSRSLNTAGADTTTGVQPTSNITTLNQSTASVSSSAPRLDMSEQSAQEMLLQHPEGMVDVTSSGDDHAVPAEDPESASGTSAVAIDNKIEQAMDLVKSHLMFAVREEVEVLKEKIAELMERISQLEVENNLLRAHAPPDVVASLPQQPPGAVPQYPPNGSVS